MNKITVLIFSLITFLQVFILGLKSKKDQIQICFWQV